HGVGHENVPGLLALSTTGARRDQNMCGIAGIFHRGGQVNIGHEMTSMLLSMKHRGPDSSGYAVYGVPTPGQLVVRFKVAEQEAMSKGFEIHERVKERRLEVDSRIQSMGGEIVTA